MIKSRMALPFFYLAVSHVAVPILINRTHPDVRWVADRITRRTTMRTITVGGDSIRANSSRRVTP
jgi:hypothetical protein